MLTDKNGRGVQFIKKPSMARINIQGVYKRRVIVTITCHNNFRSRGREFDLGQIPYFRGD